MSLALFLRIKSNISAGVVPTSQTFPSFRYYKPCPRSALGRANPNRAKTLGQIGGRKNRRVVINLELPEKVTAGDLCEMTVQAIRLLLAGEMRAREACAIGQLCTSLYRMMPTADLEARVATLEIAQAESGAPEVDPIGSPTNETVAAAESDVLPAAEQTPCPTDADTLGWTDGGDGAESRSDEPDEAG